MTKRRHSTVQFNPAEWLADTARMPRIVRSVFHDLCVYVWQRAAPVPQSELYLMLSDLPEGQGEAIIENLVAGEHLERLPDGSVFPGLAMLEAQRAYQLWQAKSRGGRGGAAAPVEEPVKRDPEGLTSLDEFLDEEGIREEVAEAAQKRIEAEPIGAPEIAAAWNRLASGRGLKQVSKMTAERIDRLNARIAEHGAEAIIAAIGRMADNEMVLAAKPTFDQLLQPQTCATIVAREEKAACE